MKFGDNYARSQKIHFIRRFKERTGIELTHKDYFFLRDLCLKGNAKFLGYHTHNHHRCYMAIQYKNFDFVTVYDMFKKRLVTVLPESIRNIS